MNAQNFDGVTSLDVRGYHSLYLWVFVVVKVDRIGFGVSPLDGHGFGVRTGGSLAGDKTVGDAPSGSVLAHLGAHLHHHFLGVSAKPAAFNCYESPATYGPEIRDHLCNDLGIECLS